MKNRIRPIFSWIASMLFLTSILLTCNLPLTDGSKPESTYLNLGADAHYMGKEACKTCHPDKYESFSNSQMGHSFRPARLSNSIANWENTIPVFDLNRNFYYLPFRRDSGLFIREFRLAGKDTIYKREEKIDYIIGSGHHTNSHIISINGYLYQAPLTWYAQEKKWDFPPGFENGNNSRFDRQIEQECMTCHNALPQMTDPNSNRYSDIPHGIDCERCHGPGSIHVERKSAGEIVDISKYIDYSIVNPGKLTSALQMDICSRCHLQGTAVLNPGKTFADFRPGMPLPGVMQIFIPRFEDSVQNFVMASHPDRLRMSKCFVESHSENNGSKAAPTNANAVKPLTCVTCHNPHLPIETFSKEHYNLACSNCHSAADQVQCADDHTFTSRKEDDCIGCHMNKSGSSDIPHVSITDHWIRPNPAPPSSISISHPSRFIGLNCRTCDEISPSLMAEGYLSYFEKVKADPSLLDSAKMFLDVASQNPGFTAQSIRLHFLGKEYSKVIARVAEYTGSDAWTCYRIAESYQQNGNTNEAIAWFNKAVSSAPGNLKFRNKLGSALITAGKTEEGIQILNDVVGANPKFASAWNNRGFGNILTGKITEAESDFLVAISLDPDFELALANLASLYIRLGKKEKAVDPVKRLLNLDPGDESYRKLKTTLDAMK